MDRVELTVRRALLGGLAVSVALMAAGLLLSVVHGVHLPRAFTPIGHLPGALVALDPGAYLSLGLIVLIGTPFVRVAGSLIAFAGGRERRYVGVTAVVLAIMCLSVLLGRA